MTVDILATGTIHAVVATVITVSSVGTKQGGLLYQDVLKRD